MIVYLELYDAVDQLGSELAMLIYEDYKFNDGDYLRM